MDLETKIIRIVWNFVETANPYNLNRLSDGELVQELISKVEQVFILNSYESKHLAEYIGTRTLLIRDLAQSKFD